MQVKVVEELSLFCSECGRTASRRVSEHILRVYEKSYSDREQ